MSIELILCIVANLFLISLMCITIYDYYLWKTGGTTISELFRKRMSNGDIVRLLFITTLLGHVSGFINGTIFGHLFWSKDISPFGL